MGRIQAKGHTGQYTGLEAKLDSIQAWRLNWAIALLYGSTRAIALLYGSTRAIAGTGPYSGL